jgi:hypothetical protein
MKKTMSTKRPIGYKFYCNEFCVTCQSLCMEVGSLNLAIFLKLEGLGRIHIQLVIKLLAYKLTLS